jgi:hypothetical protein
MNSLNQSWSKKCLKEELKFVDVNKQSLMSGKQDFDEFVAESFRNALYWQPDGVISANERT